jgi:hypothetical protein
MLENLPIAMTTPSGFLKATYVTPGEGYRTRMTGLFDK